MQLRQSGTLFFNGRRGRQVQHERLDSRSQKVVWAAGAECGEARVLGAGEEVEDDRRIREVADPRLIRRDQSADSRGEGGGLGASFGFGERLVTGQDGSEWIRPAVLCDEVLGRVDNPQRVRFGLVARVTPGCDAVPAQDAADRGGVGFLDFGDVQTELPAGPAPGYPGDLVAEGPGGEGFAVGGGCEGDAGIRMQVVDVCGVDQ